MNRTNCYLNSAYNRNIDDFDDFIDSDSHISYDEKCRSYESENEIFVDEIDEDESNQQCLLSTSRTFNQQRSTNSEYQIWNDGQLFNTARQGPTCDLTREYYRSVSATSTPKKQIMRSPISELQTTPRKMPQKIAAAAARKRSVSAAGRIKEQWMDPVNRQANYFRRYAAYDDSSVQPMRRSISSFSLTQPKYDQRQSPKSTIAHRQLRRSKSFHYVDEPFQSTPTPHQIQPIVRRPHNSSFSSSRPLITRKNTAVISPIFNRNMSPFVVKSSPRRVPDTVSPSKTTWLQMRKQSLPLCTLRTSAIMLLISGSLSCLLCFHIVSEKGKSYELSFGMVSSFLMLCLGFPCLRFQNWQWLPNRNYVSGYIMVSLFGILQTVALWILDKYPNANSEVIDLTKGAVCGLASLSISIAVLGGCTSCCCKYPPPDNRVTHGVQGFTV